MPPFWVLFTQQKRNYIQSIDSQEEKEGEGGRSGEEKCLGGIRTMTGEVSSHHQAPTELDHPALLGPTTFPPIRFKGRMGVALTLMEDLLI